MGNIKLKNILAENMRRFGTKNLNEQQLDLFKINPDIEYFHNRTESPSHESGWHPEDLMADIKQAIRFKEGREAVKVAENLLKYITVDVYNKQKMAKDSGDRAWEVDLQYTINAVQKINQDVIKNAIKALKIDPKNMVAMQTIYDILNDLLSAID
jgi:hypothetical protein